jgi:non-lysosomal glucosylceramidase
MTNNPSKRNRSGRSMPSKSTPHRHIYRGNRLREIAFPLGGIGTGTLSLGGRGDLRDWEIFNHPGKGFHLPFTFFIGYFESENGEGFARVLESRIPPPYSGSSGLPTGRVPGLPRLRSNTFRGEYPFAWLHFHDDQLPVQLSLEAFNPFVPMDVESSSLPVAFFRWKVRNPTERALSVTIALCLLNPIGLTGHELPGSRYHQQLGRNLNTWQEENVLRGILMTGEKPQPSDPHYGDMALMTDWPNVSFRLRWERAGWWDDAQNFWDDFVQSKGHLVSDPEASLSPDHQSDVATLALHAHLAPRSSVELPFLIAWRFPNLVNYWNSEPEVRGKYIGNHYATRFNSSWAAARHTFENLADLEKTTRAFHHALYHSTLPPYVLDAVGANISILRSPTVLLTADGHMNAFEGCGDRGGCCPMNCTHVWNYAMSAAFLFPSLERSVRLTDFCHNTRPDGHMAFRTLLPLSPTLWQFKPAADGQMGTILRAYREWTQSGDRQFLQIVWPGIQLALEFAWQPGSWDSDQDGVMEGEQHNTYDIEFYGPNPLCSILYLGALRAAEEMAKALGFHEKATEYRQRYEQGGARLVELLWNGEFFRQIVTTTNSDTPQPATPKRLPLEAEPLHQFGAGCLSDQLLGQWMAHIVGLGYLLPPEFVKKAIESVFYYNWKPDLSQHASVQRCYAFNDESGLLLCTWPHGKRPRYPFPYADEVWTGIEYQVAGHLIYEGKIEEGLAIVRGVRNRHDGERRNPWNEFECGHHYARALSSWGLLLALSGVRYSAPTNTLDILPRWPADPFRCLFTAGTAWGTVNLDRKGVLELAILWGSFELASIRLPPIFGPNTTAFLQKQPISVTYQDAMLHLRPKLSLTLGDKLRIEASSGSS